MIEVLVELRPVVVAIEGHDRDLARQLRRGGQQCGAQPRGGERVARGSTRRERYRNALGSARETGSCLDVAVACGYVGSVDAGLLDRLDKVRATLAKVAR